MPSLSLSAPQTFSLYNKPAFSPKPTLIRPLKLPPNSNRLFFNPLRVSIELKKVMGNGRRGRFGPVCYAGPLTTRNLQWISTISTSVLMFAKGTAIQKSFLVPLFALQAPATIVSWIRGEYGIWTAFLAVLIRLFFFIPDELNLPFVALLLVILAPYQAMNLRGTQEGLVLSLVIAGYLAFQHFSMASNLRKAFDQGSIIATLAIICTCLVPCVLLI